MENNKFEWTDNAVLEFLTYQSNEWPQGAQRRKALEDFKKSKKPVSEWEILCIQGNKSGMIYEKRANGYSNVEEGAAIDCFPHGEHNCRIYTVIRRSDNSIWTKGDKFKTESGIFIIENFRILNKYHIEVIDTKGHTSLLFYIEKVKEPELQWFVIPQNTSVPLNSIPGWTPIKQKIGNMGGYANCQYFPDEESANAFIINNKPCLSVKEVNDLFTKRTGYGMGIENFLDLKKIVKSKS